jgi:hypothetical protein
MSCPRVLATCLRPIRRRRVAAPATRPRLPCLHALAIRVHPVFRRRVAALARCMRPTPQARQCPLQPIPFGIFCAQLCWGRCWGRKLRKFKC